MIMWRIAVFLSVLMLVFLVTTSFASVPEYAPLIPDETSFVFDDFPVMPLVNVSGYDVVAFHWDGTLFYTDIPLYPGTATIYNGLGTIFGFYIAIPPNASGGYLYVCGFFPAYATTSVGTGWQDSVPLASVNSVAPFYCLMPDIRPVPYQFGYGNSGSETVFPTFDGRVYVPPHVGTLYLMLFGNATNVRGGASRSSNSFISFVPDVDYLTPLNVISSNTSTANTIANSISSNTSTANVIANNVLSKITSIDNQLNDLVVASGAVSPMDKFESDYLDNFSGQISKTEDALSPSNPALPNGGDVAGFASDISDGLGLSGSFFSASDFSAATSAFSGSSATGEGGPWEFFTQGVADSLAGGTMSAGLNDDDYIYAWLDQIQRRYGLWVSSSP